MTFRNVRRLANAHRERIVSLVLVPALFLGTLPQAACICADGHREQACPMLRRQFASRPAVNNCCTKNCCQKRDSEELSPCCLTRSCQTANDRHVPASGIAAKTGSCCQAIFEAAAPIVVTKKAVALAQATLAMCAACSSLVPAIDLWPALAPATQSTPPPFDVVIVFSRLTI